MPRTNVRNGRALGRRGRAFAPALALGLSAAGCLPGDQRPPPGIASAFLTPGEWLEAREPLVTDDGWSVVFDRVLVASNRVDESYNPPGGPQPQGGQGCEVYYNTTMIALYDAVMPGPKLLGRLAGLGLCGLGVGWGAPPIEYAPFDVLGPGVTDDDARRVVTNLTTGEIEGGAGLYVVGVASKGAAQKSFALPFSALLLGCIGQSYGVALEEGRPVDVAVGLRPERLFSDNIDGRAARLRFEALARADDLGDADGEVTREELDARSLDDLAEPGGAYVVPEGVPFILWPGPGGGGKRPSLLDFISWQARRVFLEGDVDPCSY